MTNPAAGLKAPPFLAGVTPEETASLRLVVTAVVACVLGERKDHPDVEDCTHEALSRAIEGKSRLREGEPWRPWVIGIARHVALDALRRRKKARREESIAPGPDQQEDAAPALVDALPDPSPGPEERTASAERAARLERALGQIPEDQRRALVMFHVEGLGYGDIAKRLGVPLGTVATWLSRGRKMLAESVGE
ncbi:RNA polymerase sigma factor [Polyangium aurulentum]|uniref:RNA polymerase sigma factor n=1 Tax=Polyangium aurulentum TaxID=2567896 RepID=UPI00146EF173|nr:sigma-70 family RNA polymerase sigma factor [Polyangium aurulentum]UQA62950.1 sigma-70 family RNA polymerase sigma factor [Polyangium aurulentum]